jgi:hypothetical protein
MIAVNSGSAAAFGQPLVPPGFNQVPDPAALTA